MVLETTSDKKDVVTTGIEDDSDLGEFRDPDLSLDEAMEALIHWTGSQIGSEDVIRACEEFAVTTGKVFHDDDFYDSRMSHFMDHYLFERTIDGQTPYQRLSTCLGNGLNNTRALDCF